jgi:hypothetical protein
MGLNEFAGYVAVTGSALATGWMATQAGLRPEPFNLGVVYAVMGLARSAFVVRETRHHVAHEMAKHVGGDHASLSQFEVFRRTSLADRNRVARCAHPGELAIESLR